MAKASFGEYGAFTSKNSIRFTRNQKMVSESSLPPEVVAFLKEKLPTPEAIKDVNKTQTPELPKAKFPRPSEEELAKMRAESVQVKPELQATPEKLAEDAEALTDDDFAVEETMEESTAPSAEQLHDVSKVISDGRFGAHTIADIDPPFPDSTGQAPLPRAVEPVRPVESSDFLESVSIHTAKLEDIVRALYERFGIYTVYLRQLPNPDEINPLTGEPFTKYHQGIAYQAALGAQNRGILDRPAEEGRRIMEEGRAASANLPIDQAPVTFGDARRADSFDFRTSVRGNQNRATTEIVHVKGEDGIVHAVQREIPAGETGEFNGAKSRYDEDEDERIVEPQIGRQVVRPDW